MHTVIVRAAIWLLACENLTLRVSAILLDRSPGAGRRDGRRRWKMFERARLLISFSSPPLYSLSAGDNNGRRDRLSRSVRSFNVTDPCRRENRSWMEMEFAFAWEMYTGWTKYKYHLAYMQDVLLISLIFVFSLQNGIIFFFYVNQYSFVFLVEKNIRSCRIRIKIGLWTKDILVWKIDNIFQPLSIF